MKGFLAKYGFSEAAFFQLILITINAQLIYAFWDIRNSVPGGFPAALGVTDQEAGYLYSMQGLVILLGTIALGWECLRQGAAILRVHDVREAVDTVRIFKAFRP